MLGITMHHMTPPDTDGHLLCAKEVAKRLGVSLRSVRRLIRDGKIPALRIGHAVRVDPEELRRALRRVRA